MLPQGFHSTEKLLSINFLNSSSVNKIAICVYWQYVLPKLPVQRFSFFVPGVPVGKKKAFNSFSCGPTTCQACFYFHFLHRFYLKQWEKVRQECGEKKKSLNSFSYGLTIHKGFHSLHHKTWKIKLETGEERPRPLA